MTLSVHFWFGFRSSGGSDSSVIITPPLATRACCLQRARATKSCFSASGFLVIHCNSYIHAAARAGHTLQTAYSAGLIYQCAVDSSRRHRCYRYARRRSAQKIPRLPSHSAVRDSERSACQSLKKEGGASAQSYPDNLLFFYNRFLLVILDFELILCFGRDADIDWVPV